MNIYDTFFSMPTPLITVLIITFYLAVTVVIFFLQTFIRSEHRENHTQMVNSVTSSVGTMYGLLLASIAVIIIENRTNVSLAFQAEANAVADICLLSLTLPKNLEDKIHENLKDYLRTVKNVEWKALNQGKVVYNARKHLLVLQKHLFEHPINSGSETIIIQKIFDILETVYKSRNERNEGARYKTPTYVWIILLMGSFVVISCCALFTPRQTQFYLLLLSLVGIAIGLIMSLMVAYDRPFMGYLAIQPVAVDEVLKIIDDTRLLKDV